MFESYKEFVDLLDSIGFKEFYLNTVSSQDYSVDYGKRKGRLEFDSISAASKKYMYESSGKYMIHIDEQLPILNDQAKINESELILQCIEVFDWGGVQASNIIKAIALHRSGNLKDHLLFCKNWFENDSTTELKGRNVIWSSGWTKIYSFMFDMTTIYDSRVSAFINYIFTKFYYSIENDYDRKKLASITSKLITFKGASDRKRCVNAKDRELLGIKMKSGSHVSNFIANKIASWFVRYLADLEFSLVTQQNFRHIDKAAFMLGFDIAQIDPELNFE